MLKKNLHKSLTGINKEISIAKKKITMNGIYSHFKDPASRYKVIGFGITENDDELCVLYQRTDNSDVTFIRPVKSWLEKIELNGIVVDRFKLIK